MMTFRLSPKIKGKELMLNAPLGILKGHCPLSGGSGAAPLGSRDIKKHP